MPRNVRNFWMDAEIDGRESRLSGGPQSKDGGLFVTFKQRHKGSVTDALTIHAVSSADGSLALQVFDADGVRIYMHETIR